MRFNPELASFPAGRVLYWFSGSSGTRKWFFEALPSNHIVMGRIEVQLTPVLTAKTGNSMPLNYDGSIPTRAFGSSGDKISILGFGGHHLGEAPDEKTAVEIVHQAVDGGITFFDNCWEYRRGKTEVWMGAGLKGRRDKIFLMTKTCPHGRDASVALLMLEESLRRLQTDHLDLWQVHGMAFENDPELFIRPNGAAEALEKAKKDGKVRYVGFTGHHNPKVHLAMLQTGFKFDAVQMPLNAFDSSFRSFEQQVLPELNRRGIAVLGMKPLNGHGEAIKNGAITAEEALRYAMSLPVTTTITGMDSLDVLHQNLQIAQTFKPFTEVEMNTLRERCKQEAADGRYELYKLSLKFDNPEARLAHGFPLDTQQSEVKDMLGSAQNTGHPFPEKQF
jgi:aryl-alcohol dehydrogenase-like predicted oxidoreductase